MYLFVLRVQTYNDGPFYTEGIFDTYSKAQEYVEKNEFHDFTIEKVQYFQ